MRTRVFLVASALVLLALNWAIVDKERLKARGETLLLELAPVDPRSLMQGDYMRLRYAAENSARESGTKIAPWTSGRLVVKLDSDGIGRFARFHAGEDLAPEERLVKFTANYDGIQIRPDSFLFQEGHADLYARSKYGVFKVDKSGDTLLVGLAGEDRRTIEPRATGAALQGGMSEPLQ